MLGWYLGKCILFKISYFPFTTVEKRSLFCFTCILSTGVNKIYFQHLKLQKKTFCMKVKEKSHVPSGER